LAHYKIDDRAAAKLTLQRHGPGKGYKLTGDVAQKAIRAMTGSQRLLVSIVFGAEWGMTVSFDMHGLRQKAMTYGALCNWS